MNPNLSKRTWTLKPNVKSKPTHLKNFQLRNNTSYTQKPKNQKAIHLTPFDVQTWKNLKAKDPKFQNFNTKF